MEIQQRKQWTREQTALGVEATKHYDAGSNSPSKSKTASRSDLTPATYASASHHRGRGARWYVCASVASGEAGRGTVRCLSKAGGARWATPGRELMLRP